MINAIPDIQTLHFLAFVCLFLFISFSFSNGDFELSGCSLEGDILISFPFSFRVNCMY